MWQVDKAHSSSDESSSKNSTFFLSSIMNTFFLLTPSLANCFTINSAAFSRKSPCTSIWSTSVGLLVIEAPEANFLPKILEASASFIPNLSSPADKYSYLTWQTWQSVRSTKTCVQYGGLSLATEVLRQEIVGSYVIRCDEVLQSQHAFCWQWYMSESDRNNLFWGSGPFNCQMYI